MAKTLFALCTKSESEKVICRIPLETGVQAEVERMFDSQEKEFLRNRDALIEFKGDWHPDGNELLFIHDPDLVNIFNETFEKGPTAYDPLDISNYDNAGIKAIFMHSSSKDRILIQKFRSIQYLQRKGLTLTFSNNMFGKVSNKGFSLDDRLGAVVDKDDVLFASFHTLRTFLTVQNYFIEATQQEVNDFANHSSIHIDDLEKFHNNMDEKCRKLIKGISKSNVLQEYEVNDIVKRAKIVGLELKTKKNRISLPSVKKELKIVLSFLEESVYKGIFTEQTLITNSKKPISS